MASQFLPNSTGFDEPDPSGCPSPQLYTMLRPWSSAITAWNIECEVGSMTDQDGGATFTPFPQGAPERKMGWCAFDGITQADGSAYLRPQFKVIAGAADEDTFGAIGVGARIQDGTWTNVGNAEGYVDVPDGYYFVHARSVGVGDRLFLIRMYGGTAFQINTKVLTPKTGDAFVFPRPMKIECDGNIIRCYRDQAEDHGTTDYTSLPVGVTVDPSPPDDLDLVFAVEDNSATAITTAGRFGFGLMQPLRDGSTDSVVVGKEFTVKDSAGAVLVSDKFERAYPAAAKRMIDGLSRGGYCVTSAFTGDYGGRQTSPAFFRNLAQLATDDISRGPLVNINGIDQEWGWHISQRPADSADQSRELHFHLTNLDASNDRVVGILLRGTWTGNSPPLEWVSNDSSGRNGYQFEVKWAQANSPQFRIDLVDYHGFSSGPVLLATATLSGLALGSDHELIASVEGSPARLRAVFNGTPINSWSVPSGLNGVTTFGEYVTDARSEQHETGSLEGFHFRATSNLGTPLVWFDYWGPGPAVGDEVVDPSSQASYPVPLEDWNKTADVLTVNLGLPISVEDQREVLAQRTRSGHSFRIPQGSLYRRLWRAGLTGRTKTEIDTLEAFIVAHKGSEVPFRWTEPHAHQSVLVRFHGDAFEAIRKVRGGQAAALELQEVFEHA